MPEHIGPPCRGKPPFSPYSYPCCESRSPVAPSDFDGLISGYRLTQTAVYRDTALLRPIYIGIPPYSDRLISGYRLTQTALYRDTALLRPPYIGIPPYSDRLISEYRLTLTALYRNTALLRPPYIGIPPYSDRLVTCWRTPTAVYRGPETVEAYRIGEVAILSAIPQSRQAILTFLYRDTAFFGPPFGGRGYCLYAGPAKK